MAEPLITKTGVVPTAEDVFSVGSRISWGAILAGSVLALAILFLLTLLGGAVGLSIGDRVEPSKLRTGAVIWALVTTCAALFVGGLAISQFTVGETKAEAVMYGLIMWALLFGFLLALSAAGVRAGLGATANMANLAETATTESWDASARRAGVPADQIDAWRTKLSERADKSPGVPASDDTRKANHEAATRITWYTFLGVWVSMMAAAAGAWVGAGPTFRAVVIRTRVPA
ncbi:MAG: hypothetical protein U0793_31655 [Gemmataceae bacterium]